MRRVSKKALLLFLVICDVWMINSGGVEAKQAFGQMVNISKEGDQYDPFLLDLGSGHYLAAFDRPAPDHHAVGLSLSLNNGLNWTDGGKLPSGSAGDSFAA